MESVLGKSTLLRHISQRHLPIPQHIRILHVEQEVVVFSSSDSMKQTLQN